MGVLGRVSRMISEVPTLIDGNAARDRKLTFAGAGGSFSVIASVADEAGSGSTSN
jgi:hypothetical protein